MTLDGDVAYKMSARYGYDGYFDEESGEPIDVKQRADTLAVELKRLTTAIRDAEASTTDTPTET